MSAVSMRRGGRHPSYATGLFAIQLLKSQLELQCFQCRRLNNKYTSHKTTAAQNEVALSYHRVRGLYFLAVVFVVTIYLIDFFIACYCSALKQVKTFDCTCTCRYTTIWITILEFSIFNPRFGPSCWLISYPCYANTGTQVMTEYSK